MHMKTMGGAFKDTRFQRKISLIKVKKHWWGTKKSTLRKIEPILVKLFVQLKRCQVLASTPRLPIGLKRLEPIRESLRRIKE